MGLFWPKPKDAKKKPKAAFRVFSGGREVCDLLIKAGWEEYKDRIRKMWERQHRRCSLEGIVESCPGYLRISEATFEHDEGRGMGGGCRDDRIEAPDNNGKMAPQNGAAHLICNSKKGSIRKSHLLNDYLDVP